MASMSVAALVPEAMLVTSRSPAAILEAFGLKPSASLATLERIAGAAGFMAPSVDTLLPARCASAIGAKLELLLPLGSWAANPGGPSVSLATLERIAGAAGFMAPSVDTLLPARCASAIGAKLELLLPLGSWAANPGGGSAAKPYPIFERSSSQQGYGLSTLGLTLGGISAGLMLMNHKQNPPSDVDDQNGSDDFVDPFEDPKKRIERLVRKVLARVNRMPIERSATDGTNTLERWIGPGAAKVAVECFRFVRNQGTYMYYAFLVGLSCLSLDINVVQAARIIRIIILEQRDEVHAKLDAYDRAAKRKPGEADEAEAVVLFSAYNLSTGQLEQILLLMNAESKGTFMKCIKGDSKIQLALPKPEESFLSELVAPAGEGVTPQEGAPLK